MRLAVFIKSTTFNKNHGGLETQNKVLCEGLAKRGYEVIVFSPTENKIENYKILEENSVKYVFVPSVYRMLFNYKETNWVNTSYKEFLKWHKEKPFDLVISQSSAGLGIIKRKKILRTKILGISHGTIGAEIKTLINASEGLKDYIKISKNILFGTVNYFSRQRSYINGCDLIIAVSNFVKESIIKETLVKKEKVIVIHNGMDASKIPQKVWANIKPPLKILYAGRIDKSKGLKELLLSCKDLDEVFLNIAGDGPLLEELKNISRFYKMSQKVLFYGKLPFEKMVEMYSCNDVFVLPTKRLEGLPMTLVEACFAGIPIIATDIGGIKDVVNNGENGFLVSLKNVNELKEKIEILMKDKNLAQRMGLNGRIKAENNFEVNKMLDKYEKAFEMLKLSV